MMWPILVCVLAIVILIWLRYQVQRLVHAVVILMGGSNRTGVMVYTFLFLPGVIVHELTHFITAALLGVPTGEIHLFPRTIEDSKSRIALGSVKIAKVDFFRESLIGAAPFMAGCVVMFLLVRALFWPLPEFLGTIVQSPLSFASHIHLGHVLAIYLIWTIANTMFLSAEDTRSFPGLIIFLFVVMLLLFLTGSLINFGTFVYPYMVMIAQIFAGVFGFVVVVDGLLASVLFVWVRWLQKLTRKRVVFAH